MLFWKRKKETPQTEEKPQVLATLNGHEKQEKPQVLATLNGHGMEIAQSYRVGNTPNPYGVVRLQRTGGQAACNDYGITLFSRELSPVGKTKVVYFIDSRMVSAFYNGEGNLAKVELYSEVLQVSAALGGDGKLEVINYAETSNPAFPSRPLSDEEANKLANAAWERAKSFEEDLKKLREDPVVKKALEEVSK